MTVLLSQTGPTHDIGDRRKLAATVTDENGTLIDPATVSFTMREPDGTRTTLAYPGDAEVVHDSLGVFFTYWDCLKSGKHHWRYAVTGGVAAAEEDSFTVRSSQVLPG